MAKTTPIHDLFLQMLDLPSEERGEFIASCSADGQVRDRLAALLEAHDEAPDFLETDALRGPVIDLPVDLGLEGIGGSIGRYKLLQQIGEGGFGVVYMADQEEPVRRRVALKVIKLGMDTKQVIGRFEAERQALAMMDHPNIAKVLDAGATETGRPYFVMELVKGIPITEYCDQHNLTVTERLGLFQLVCHAVQHAHQKGIIHRDLKPSNIMVTLHDGQPVPKVIDFGIAKAMNQKLTERTVFTEFRQFIGTPEYMSPEQADISGLDVDTRSDIYALGVLLYELLTGVTPFDPKTLRNAAYGEIQRIIREELPPKPSTRLTGVDGLDVVAARRGSEPGKLGHVIRGELDWIVMRAMEKDRTRRYETANGLAKDIERYLSDEPVVAGPPRASYRMRKFVHRNRAAVLVASIVVFCLVTALSGALVGLKAVMDSKEEIAAERDRADDLFRALVPPDLALAVRPLANASGDPAQDYFADGMTRALIGELARVDAIEVRSFESVAKLADSERTDAEIAEDLGVDFLLTGEVSRHGDRVEMSVDLSLPENGDSLLRETYTGDWAEVFDLQRVVAEDTLHAVRLTEDEMPPPLEQVKRGDTSNAQARDWYDRGAHNLRAPDGTDLDRAIEFFDKALALDPDYARAHLGKAKAYLMKATIGVQPDAFNPPALDAARAAIAIDDTLADAWAVLGQIQISYLYEWDGARKSLERALALDPDNPEAHIGMAASHISAGETDVGIEHLKRAIEIDPAILLVNEATTYLAYFARDYDLTVEICEHALDLDKDWWAPKAWMGLALGYKGESTRQAGITLLEEAWEQEQDSPITLACLAGLYAADGQKALAQKHLDHLVDWAGSRYICPYEIATVFIALGKLDMAFEYLHAAVDASSECIPFIGMDIRLDVIRDDPELDQIMRGIEHPLYGKPQPWLESADAGAPAPDDA